MSCFVVSFDFCECCLRQINLFILLFFINRLEDDEAENTMSILVGECFSLLAGRLALHARSSSIHMQLRV